MHLLWILWFGYAWPSLKGNGPEDLMGFVLLGGGGVWAYRQLRREWRDHREHLAALHAKVNHVILSTPHITNAVPGVPSHLQPTRQAAGAASRLAQEGGTSEREGGVPASTSSPS